MKKQTVLAKKRRGPAPTGKGVQIVVRMQPAPLASLDDWAAKQKDRPTRAEAIRRLVEIGLTVKPKDRPKSKGQKQRAREMAGGTIDRLADSSANPDDQASRKRRLIKGPEEFRNVRVDRPSRKT
jgi:hypothetical protein